MSDIPVDAPQEDKAVSGAGRTRTQNVRPIDNNFNGMMRRAGFQNTKDLAETMGLERHSGNHWEKAGHVSEYAYRFLALTVKRNELLAAASQKEQGAVFIARCPSSSHTHSLTSICSQLGIILTKVE